MPKYTKVQPRHDAAARTFLAMLAESENGRMRSTAIKTDLRIRHVCRNRGFAKAWGRGMGATWMITEAGKAFLATTPIAVAEEPDSPIEATPPALAQVAGVASNVAVAA